MAEAVFSFVGVILEKLLPLAADEISRVWGVKTDLEKLVNELKLMQAVISDAKSKPSKSEIVNHWLKELQSIARDAEIVLDDFGYEVLRRKVKNRKRDKVRNFFSSSNPFSFRQEMANKIKNVRTSLEEAYEKADRIGLRPVELTTMTSTDLKKDRMTVRFVDESEMVGREVEVSQVVSMLVSSDYKKDLPVISIVGMGGQGKTTLAQVVLKNKSVVEYFDKKIIWVCVSDDFKVERLLNEMLQSLGKNSAGMTTGEALVRELQENLKGKRYLLVLDDIWNDNRERWDGMRRCLLAIEGAPGSKILVTTRRDEVASAMQTSGLHRLDILSEYYSWMLFEKLAFADGGARKTQDLEDIGRRILKRCGGVPLAIKVIGSLLCSKKEASEWLKLEKSEIWNEPTNTKGGVISVLKLSYENLPSFSVKQCFASCSIFPKDTLMEKQSLIQIWMAQGLINDEDIGSDCFNTLLRSSFLQASSENSINEINFCRMHDLVHDLSLKVSNNCILNTEDGMVVNHDDEVMHLTIILSRGQKLKKIKGIPPNLQTFYLVGDGMLKDIMERSRYLCVLKVDCRDVTDLPNAVGNMKHLRYLDISNTRITTLPDSITKLYNLMTLKVGYLKEIPKKFSNLINLRHFQFSFSSSQCLFPGIGQLANLRTLPYFVVSQDKGCQLEELEHLHNLQGKLKIFGMENVRSFESAAKANLSGKSSIQSLELSWNVTKEDFDDNNIISVMEGLQPHSTLKSLAIEGFKGSRFPLWMVAKNHLRVLRNLADIKLERLDKCEQVPPLGDLPNLESLEMLSLPNVKRIGAEFYGLEHLDNAGSSNCSSSRGVKPATLFPRLSHLVLEDMNSLEEWSDAMAPSDSSSIKVFPNLRHLRIRRVPKLAVLPLPLAMENLTCLTELSIRECYSLACIRNLDGLTSLESLSLSYCLDLDVSLDMKNPQSLRTLSICGCDKLNPSLSNNLEKFTSLERLTIIYNDLRKGSTPSWAKDLCHLANLRLLELGGFSHDVEYFPWPDSITNVGSGAKDDADSTKQYFFSLEELRLSGWPKITSLPDQIQHLSTLITLQIWKFHGLEVLPEWMGSLRNLQELRIVLCSNLRQLPSAQVIRHLTNLNWLHIERCPLLAVRCTSGSGAEWPKIAHIPHIYIN